MAALVATGLMRLAAEDAFRPAWFWVLSTAVLVFGTTLYQTSRRTSG